MKRIAWIDSLKGFGIFCVTFGHLACNFWIEKHIYSFHMFLFFFISGYLYSDKQIRIKEYIVKKTKTLYLPFLFWNFLSVLVGVLLGKGIPESIRLLFLLDGEICWNAPIWFLLLLYMTEILYFFIERYIPYGKYICLPVLLILWYFASGKNVFLKLNILPICLLFYILGNIFVRFHKRYCDTYFYKHQTIMPICALLLGVNFLFGVLLNDRISFTGAYFGNIFYSAVAAIAGVFFYVFMFQNINILSNSKVLSYLGKNSLIIMATQYYFFTFYDIVFSQFINGSIWYYRNTLKALIIAVVTIVLICGIVELLRIISKKLCFVDKICYYFGIR